MSMQIMSIRVKESTFLIKWNIWMVRPSVGLSILLLIRVLSHVCAHVICVCVCVCGVSVRVHGEYACVRTPPILRSPLACPLQFDGSSLWEERCSVTATQHQRTVQWLSCGDEEPPSGQVRVQQDRTALLRTSFGLSPKWHPIPYIVYYFWAQWTQIELF